MFFNFESNLKESSTQMSLIKDVVGLFDVRQAFVFFQDASKYNLRKKIRAEKGTNEKRRRPLKFTTTDATRRMLKKD